MKQVYVIVSIHHTFWSDKKQGEFVSWALATKFNDPYLAQELMSQASKHAPCWIQSVTIKYE